MDRCLTIARKVVHWLFLAVTVVFLLSGLGIYYAKETYAATFGILTKPLSFKLHVLLWIPFTVLLALHLLFTILLRRVFTKR